MSGRLPIIVGYPVVFDVVSGPVPGHSDRERVRRGGLTLGFPGYPLIPCTIGHDPDRRIARTADGSLRLTIDSIGLRAEADPNSSPWGPDAVELIRAGTVRGMSFTMHEAVRGEPRLVGGHWTRDLLRCVVTEVALAYWPVYVQATVRLVGEAAPRRQEPVGSGHPEYHTGFRHWRY